MSNISDFFQVEVVKSLTEGSVDIPSAARVLSGARALPSEKLAINDDFLWRAWVVILQEGSYDNCHKWWHHATEMRRLKVIYFSL
jgi:hypothetical protein